MARIKTLKAKNLIDVNNGNNEEIIYPITSIKSVYTEDNVRLDDYLNDKIPDNLSTDGTGEIEKLTFSQLYNRIALEDEKNKIAGKSYIYQDVYGRWHHIYFTGTDEEAKTDMWNDSTYWYELSGMYVLYADYFIEQGSSNTYTAEDNGKIVLDYQSSTQKKNDTPVVCIIKEDKNTNSYGAEEIEDPSEIRLNYGDEFIVIYNESDNKKAKAYSFRFVENETNKGIRINPECIQSDWEESDTTSLAYIKNKPDLLKNPETTSKIETLIGGGNKFFDWRFENGRFGYGELGSYPGNLMFVSNSNYNLHSLINHPDFGNCLCVRIEELGNTELFSFNQKYFETESLSKYNKFKMAFRCYFSADTIDSNAKYTDKLSGKTKDIKWNQWDILYTEEMSFGSQQIIILLNYSSTAKKISIYVKDVVMICGNNSVRDITEYDFAPSLEYQNSKAEANNLYTNYNCKDETIGNTRALQLGSIDGYVGNEYYINNSNNNGGVPTSTFKFNLNIPKTVKINESFQVGFYVKDKTYFNDKSSFVGVIKTTVKFDGCYSQDINPDYYTWQKIISPILKKTYEEQTVKIEISSNGKPLVDFGLAYICINKVNSVYHKFNFSSFTEESTKEIETQTEFDFSNTKISIIANDDRLSGLLKDISAVIPLGETKELITTRKCEFGRFFNNGSTFQYKNYYKKATNKYVDYYYSDQNGSNNHSYTKLDDEKEISAKYIYDDAYFSMIGTPDILILYINNVFIGNNGAKNAINIIKEIIKKRSEQNTKTKYLIIFGHEHEDKNVMMEVVDGIRYLGDDIIIMQNYDIHKDDSDPFSVLKKEISNRIIDYLKSNKYYLING